MENKKDLAGQNELKSKKDMILSLFNSGVTEIETIAVVSGARPRSTLNCLSAIMLAQTLSKLGPIHCVGVGG